MRLFPVVAVILSASACTPAYADPAPDPGPGQETCAFLPYPQSLQCQREQHRAYCNATFPRFSAAWIACIREDV